MLPITAAMLSVTHKCNLACKYCFVNQCPEDMTFDTAKKAADWLAANANYPDNIPEINFFGGEPLLRWDDVVKPLISYIRCTYRYPYKLSMTTNGVLLTEDKLRYLKKMDVGILISIDGSKETQDYNRPFHNGNGSFDVIEPNILTAIELYPALVFRMTLIPDTCHNFMSNVMYAQSIGYNRVFAMPNVFEEWTEEKREVMRKQLRIYSEYYIASYKKGVIPIDFNPLENAFKDILLINQAIDSEQYRTNARCKACNQCGIGATKFAAIDPLGDIYSCQELTSTMNRDSIFYIGNLTDGIYEERREALTSLYNAIAVSGANCAECKYDVICDGGCAANNYLVNGDINKIPEVFCWWRQILLDEAIYVATVLGEAECFRFKKHWEVICNG
ncbi:MAG: radical SAM protein [Clostridia bacterium]|nr:radical SAM protein [Clostridia bacterium]